MAQDLYGYQFLAPIRANFVLDFTIEIGKVL